MKVLVTGSKGFIAGYLIQELLDNGYDVIGIDNFSKYGNVTKSYDSHPNYTFIEGDAKDKILLENALVGCTHFIMGAAMIGGISYFHEFAYDLLAENERILAASFDAAIYAYKEKFGLKKVTVLSSSMVYESATEFPTPEGHEYVCPPPLSTYGFQKLATHYFAEGAWKQYELPYTICIPFNAVGVGEYRAKTDKEIMSGNVKLAMSHVIPDLVQKILKGQNPLHILGCGEQIRHYTYAGDLARGIVKTLDNPATINNSFNISTSIGHTVVELAQIIWEKINPNVEFNYVCDPGYEYDVMKRIPDTRKMKQVCGFEATTSLETALDEIIPWVREMILQGKI